MSGSSAQAAFEHTLVLEFDNKTTVEHTHQNTSRNIDVSEINQITSIYKRHDRRVMMVYTRAVREIIEVIIDEGPVQSPDVSPVRALTAPPPLAEFICAAFVPKQHKDALLGDLASDHNRHARDFNKARADRLYWAATLRAVWPLLYRWTSRISWLGIGSAIGKWLGS